MKKYQLMAPGPTPVPPNVLLAMARPIIHHRAAEYDALFLEVREGLKRLVQTQQDVVTPACTGTGAMEAAVANTLSAGDRVIVVNAGAFAQRWLAICKAYGLRVVELEAPHGDTVSPDRVAEALREHKDVKAVLVQHSESSTGVLHDVRGYAQATRATEAILVVDAVSSLGIAELPMDAWGIDVVVSASQKGLMLPPGLGLLALSEKAWAAAKRSTLPKYYLDLTEERKYTARNEARFTPAVSIMVGLREVLRMIDEEGLPNVLRRHDRLSRATRGRRGGARAHPLPQDHSESRAHRGAGAGGSGCRPGRRAVRHVAQHHHRRRPRADEGQDLPHRPHGLCRRLRHHQRAGRARAGAPRAGAADRLRRLARSGPEGVRRAGVVAVG